jgi:hypothetical protein
MVVVTNRLVNVSVSTRLRRNPVHPDNSVAAVNYDLFHYAIICSAFPYQIQPPHQLPNALTMGSALAVSVTTVSVQSRMAEEAEERWEVIVLYW